MTGRGRGGRRLERRLCELWVCWPASPNPLLFNWVTKMESPTSSRAKNHQLLAPTFHEEGTGSRAHECPCRLKGSASKMRPLYPVLTHSMSSLLLSCGHGQGKTWPWTSTDPQAGVSGPPTPRKPQLASPSPEVSSMTLLLACWGSFLSWGLLDSQ